MVTIIPYGMHDGKLTEVKVQINDYTEVLKIKPIPIEEIDKIKANIVNYYGFKEMYEEAQKELELVKEKLEKAKPQLEAIIQASPDIHAIEPPKPPEDHSDWIKELEQGLKQSPAQPPKPKPVDQVKEPINQVIIDETRRPIPAPITPKSEALRLVDTLKIQDDMVKKGKLFNRIELKGEVLSRGVQENMADEVVEEIVKLFETKGWLEKKKGGDVFKWIKDKIIR